MKKLGLLLSYFVLCALVSMVSGFLGFTFNSNTPLFIKGIFTVDPNDKYAMFPPGAAPLLHYEENISDFKVFDWERAGYVGFIDKGNWFKNDSYTVRYSVSVTGFPKGLIIFYKGCGIVNSTKDVPIDFSSTVDDTSNEIDLKFTDCFGKEVPVNLVVSSSPTQRFKFGEVTVTLNR